MQNKFFSFLFSTRLMAVLFLTYGAALGIGTFIETYHSTDTARIWIYNAWWFELIMLLFVVNFIGNIKRYSLTKKENWAVFVLHISWIFIIVGAFITRYISDEGRMSIREGETVDFYTSERTYITIQVDGKHQGQELRKVKQSPVLFSEPTNNSFRWKSDFKGTDFDISYKKFIKGAYESFVADNSGDFYFKIVENSAGSRHEHYIKSGEVANIHNVLFALNKPTQGAINFHIDENGNFIQSPFEGFYMTMSSQERTQVVKDSLQPLHLLTLYAFGDIQFVLPEPMTRGRMQVMKIPQDQATNNAEDAVVLTISSGGKSKEVAVLGRRDVINPPTTASVNGLDFHISYGSIRKELPFQIKLNDFIADKYPGTEKSYSAFKSKVSVLGEKESFDYDIFMNNILNYKGYRFFQASFHPDEKGTVLSVNHDFWGTLITYIGYTLLYIGLIASMFFGKTRFVTLSRKLKELQQKRKLLSILLLLVSLPLFAQHSMAPDKQQIDSILKASIVSTNHADKFGHLVIQDDDGRMKPINTFASELLRKMSKHDNFQGMNANQAFLSMLMNPQIWYNVDFFYVKKDNDSLHKILGVDKGLKYVSAIQFFDEQFNYKLSPYLTEAYSTNTPNQFQKDFKEADMKLNLLNRALSGSILRIYPLLNDSNNKWVSPLEYRENPTVVQDSLYGNFIANGIPLYLTYLRDAVKTGDYTEADKVLAAFKTNQERYGATVMPSEGKIKAEIIYNKYDVFKRLFSWYLYAGTLMFVVLILQIFVESFSTTRVLQTILKLIKTICIISIVIFFLLHTAGLIFRWYIAGHAPWSNAYESVIYVAWATMAAGLAFARRSEITLAATAFVTSMILMIAHWNWMDPSIGTLQPVLNSYWLMLHVAVIVGSYGPFTLGAILGIIAMLLIIFTTQKNKDKISHILQEITIVNELALIVGLIMLTIGNFLGAQWANESWGRYWGWDPKETWALVSIMVYAFVIHMRLVPGLRGRWAFNFMSVVAFASILMTYFGVNFYLSGLHSYASGEKVITPNFVYYSVAIVLTLGVISYWRNKRLNS